MLFSLIRTALCVVPAFVATMAAARVSSPTPTSDTASTWRTLRVGGGGYLSGIDISPDGQGKLVWADTYGAYAWDAARQQWRQLVTAQTMPVSDQGMHNDPGVYEIRLAPSDPRRLYMAFDGYVFRSDNGGYNLIRTQ